MSNSVDQRIVEMQFDNAQFEKGVSSTIDKLKTLEQSLTKSYSGNNFNKLADNLKATGLEKSVDIVNRLGSALSNLKGVTFDAVGSITSKMMGLVKGFGIVNGLLHTGLLGFSLTKGYSRAMSLNESNFKLSGLLDGYADKAERLAIISENATEAVMDTAYGYDSAIKAAGQMVASGVQIGDELQKTLLSVSGLAAVTGRDYDSVADIMAKVAANGKVSGMELQQFASSGVNVAAVMAKQMNVSEAEIRDMIRKSQISFEAFRDMMHKEYAKHAKDANDTFTGSFANLKGALSRTFADLFQYTLNAMPKTITAIKENINAINGAVKRFLGTWKDADGVLHKSNVILGIEKFFTKAQKAQELWARSPGPKRLQAWMEDMNKDAGKFFKEFNKGAYDLMWGTILIGASLRDVSKIIYNYIRPFFAGIREYFGKNTFKTIAHNFRMAMENIVASLQGVKPPKEYIKTVKTFVGGVLSLFESVGMGLSGFFDGIKEGLSNLFEDGGGPIEFIIGSLTTFIKVFSSVRKVLSEALKPVGDLLEKAGLGEIPAIFGNAGKAIELFLKAISGKKADRKAFSNFIKDTIGKSLYDLGKKAGSNLINLIKGIRDFGKAIGDFAGPKVEAFIDFIKNLRDNFVGPIAKNIADGIGGIFRAFSDTFSDVPIISDIIRFFESLGEAISDFISGNDFSKSFDGFSAIGDLFNNINTKAIETLGPIFTDIGNGLRDFSAGFGSLAYENAIWFFEQLSNIGSRLAPVAESIRDFVSGAWSTITEAFSNVGLDFTPFLEFFGGIGESIKDLIESLTSGDFDFSTIAEFFGNVWDNIGSLKDEVAPKIAEAFGQIGQAVYDKLEGPLKDLAGWVMDIQNPLDSMVGGLSDGIDKLSGLFGVFSGGKEDTALPALDTEALDESLEGSRSALDNVFSILEGLGTAFKAVKDTIKRPADAVKDFVSNAFWGVSDAISSFTSSIDEDTINKFVSTITSMGASAVTLGAFYEIAKLLNSVSGFIYEASLLAKSLAGMAASFKKIGDAIQKNIKTQAVLNVAIAVAILVGAIVALALLEANYADQATTAMIKVVALVAVLSLIIGVFTALDAKISGFDITKLGSLGMAFVGIGAAIAILAASMMALGKMDPKEFSQGIQAVLGLLIMMSVSMAVIAAANSGLKNSLAGVAPALIGMAAAILILGAAIDYIGHIDSDAFAQGAITVGVALVALAGFAAVLGHFGYKLKAAGEGVMFFGIALGVMSLALVAMSTQPLDKLMFSLIPLASVILAVVGAAILIERSKANLALIECSAGIIAFAIAIGILAASIAAIAWVQSQGGDIVMALGVLAAAMLGMGVLMMAVGKYAAQASVAATSMLVIAGAMAIFVAMAMALNVVPLDALAVGLLKLGAVMVVLSGGIWLLGKAATAGSPGLWSITLLLLGIAGVALAFSVSAMILVHAFNLLGAVAPAAATGIVKGLQILNDGLASMEPQVAGSTKSMVGGVSRGISESAPSVGEAGTSLLVALADGIVRAIPILVIGGGMAVLSLIESVATFIDENHGRIIEAVGHLLDAVGSFLLDSITHIGDWVGEKINGFATDIGLFGEEAKQKAEEARNATTEAMTPSDGEGGMADGMSQELDNTLSVMDQKKEDLGAKGQELKDVYNNAITGGDGVDIEALSKQYGLDEETLSAVFGPAKEQVGEEGKNLSNQLTSAIGEGLLNGDTGMADLLRNSTFMNPEDISEYAKEGGLPAAEGFGAGVEEGAAGQDYTSLIVNDSNLDPEAINAKFSEAGSSGGEAFSKSFEASLNVDGSGPVAKAASSMTQPKLFSSAAKANGDAAVTSFSDALKKMSTKAKASAKDAVDAIKKLKSDAKSAGVEVGEGIIEGMIVGIENKSGGLYSIAYSVGVETAKSVKKGAKQNSPSKLTIPVGEGIIEGMIVGLKNTEGSLYKTAASIGYRGAMALSTQAAFISDFLSDIDDQPTIRPVLDLTDYEAGINRMGTLSTAVPMVSAGYVGAARAMGISNTNNRSVSVAVNLNYDAGSDANQMAFELGQALETKLAMEGV